MWAAAVRACKAAVLAAACAPAVADNPECAVCDAARRRFDTAQGLSHNAVVALAQDREGFVWLATRDGLDRLDGTHVERFAELGGHDLRGERITALAADPAGGLWIGLRDALLHLDHHSNVDPIALPRGAAGTSTTGLLTTLLADAQDLWVGLEHGLLRVRGRTARWLPAAGEAPVRALHLEGDTLLVLSGASSCSILTIRISDETQQQADASPCLHTLAAEGDGLWVDAEIRWRQGAALPALPAGHPLPRAVLPWRGGVLFAGLSGARWRGPDGQIHPLWQGRGGAGRDLDAEILAAMVDAEDGLWLASYAGALRFDAELPHFAGLDEHLDRALQAHAVSGIQRFAGRWWLGSFGLGLLAWDPQARDLQRFGGSAADATWRQHCPDFVWNLLVWQQRLQVGGACSIDAHGQVGPGLGLGGRDSLVDSVGRTWVLGAGGLFRLQTDAAHLQLAGSFETLAETPGWLWLAPSIGVDAYPEAVLSGLHPDTGAQRRLPLPPNTRVYDMHGDGNTLWLATGSGLLQLQVTSGSLRPHARAQVEAGRVFYSIAADRHGAFWIGSNRGLLRFDPEQASFRLYDQRDGVHITEFNRRSRSRDAHGRLLLGGLGGLLRFDPSPARATPRAPRPRVQRARIWNRDGERHVELQPGRTLLLAADDLTVALEFAAPGFRRAGHWRYRYRLLGADANWVEDRGGRTARYPRLAPGNYRFELQAGDPETGWRGGAAAIVLQFLPAWHESPWFRFPALLALILLAAGLYRWRVDRLLEMERLRTGIAADLHDELGSELAAISLSAATLGERKDLPTAHRQRLTQLSVSAQKVAEAMRDIVWYVNPEKDRLDALGQRLQVLARRLLGEDRVEVDNGWRDCDAGLPMALRRQLHLIAREALNNVLRHAQAQRVWLQLGADHDRLWLRLRDDGCGFDPAQRSDGSGLGNMRRRATAIGAQLDIDSAPGRGTRIELRLTHSRRRPKARAASR
jgi:signal transduction histidine kinase/ligand-binding sensor domain-containing protein